MRNFSNQYKTENIGEHSGNFCIYLLQWLRLLALSLTRMKGLLSGIFFHDSVDRETQRMIAKPIAYKKIDDKKLPNMKSGNQLKKLVLILFLTVCATGAIAQTTPGDQTVCVNATEPYTVASNVGSTYQWTITPIAGGGGTIGSGQGTNLISINWTSVGTATLQVIETNSAGCPSDPVTIVVTVRPTNTVTAASSTPTACINTAITNITHTTTGATGIGAPTG
ncbi:MAG: hypothetical protein ACR2KX_12070, partial [Chitinophagaceae bacterium]